MYTDGDIRDMGGDTDMGVDMGGHGYRWGHGGTCMGPQTWMEPWGDMDTEGDIGDMDWNTDMDGDTVGHGH